MVGVPLLRALTEAAGIAARPAAGRRPPRRSGSRRRRPSAATCGRRSNTWSAAARSTSQLPRLLLRPRALRLPRLARRRDPALPLRHPLRLARGLPRPRHRGRRPQLRLLLEPGPGLRATSATRSGLDGGEPARGRRPGGGGGRGAGGCGPLGRARDEGDSLSGSSDRPRPYERIYRRVLRRRAERMRRRLSTGSGRRWRAARGSRRGQRLSRCAAGSHQRPGAGAGSRRAPRRPWSTG